MTIAMDKHHRNGLIINDLVKSHEMDGTVKSFRCKAHENGDPHLKRGESKRSADNL
jgi:hypothetical protein